MTKFLYGFGFEAPVQRLANRRHGWDDEDSYAFFVEADSEAEALQWGQEVSEAFYRYIYIHSEWPGVIPSWKEDRYAFWIEDDKDVVEEAEADGDTPTVRFGELPDISTWPDVI